MLNSIAEHYEFDVEVPFKQLKQKHRDIILNGSGRQRIDFSYVNDRGDVIKRTHRFEGVLPNMARRFQETESSMVRENLQKFMRVTNCPSCSGTRLREESRHVFVSNQLPSITQQSIAQTLDHFNALKLKGQRATIAEKILKEIRARLQFLVDVGLNYLSLERSAEPSPAAKRSAFNWPVKSARDWWGFYTSLMNRPLAYTKEIMNGCSKHWSISGIWVTP